MLYPCNILYTFSYCKKKIKNFGLGSEKNDTYELLVWGGATGRLVNGTLKGCCGAAKHPARDVAAHQFAALRNAPVSAH